jgi:N-carbamoylputrescine amidase
LPNYEITQFLKPGKSYMTRSTWGYPPELLAALGGFGLAPVPETAPTLVRDALSQLYRYEIRRLRDRLLAKAFPKADYIGHVIALRKTYWPLSLTPGAWEQICRAAADSGSEMPFQDSYVAPTEPASALRASARSAPTRPTEPQSAPRPTRIALIQQHVSPNHGLNIHRGIDAVRRAAAAGATLVAFAELAFTRFFPQAPPSVDVRTLAEPVPGPTTDRFSALARELGIVIVLNLFERDGDATYDCSPVIDADGRLLGRTRMVHITEYPCFHERQYYQPSDLGAPVFDTRVGRVGVAICYDRHFPEYMRALALGGDPSTGSGPADLVVVPQAGVVDEWAPGMYEGELQVAAFQNGYFIALCNRVGPEERLTFAGESFVCGPDGRVIARAPRGEDAVLLADIDLGEAQSSHARRVLLKDRRPELYGEWLGRREK